MSSAVVPNHISRYWLYAGLAVFFILHMYRLAAPPNGYHRWRESDTAAVALNYYQESTSFFEPRINQRGASSGITGMELPIYNYAAAMLYRLFGPSHALARLLTIMASVLAIWLFYLIVRMTADRYSAIMASLALAFSPLFFFYSYKIMPDIWMLTLYLGAICSYLGYHKVGKLWLWVLSAFLLVLSGAIKPLVLGIYLPFFFLARTQGGLRIKRVLIFCGYVAISFLPVLGWLLYSRWLQQKYGLGAFYLGGHGLADFAHYLFTLQFLKKLFLQWPFELWIGWILVPAFVYGVYYSLKKRYPNIFYIWIVSMYIVFALTALKSSSHDYYTLVIVPAVAAVTGIGLAGFYRAGRRTRWIAIILIILAPVGSFLRISSRFGDTQDFYPIRQAASGVIPEDSLVMVQDHTPAVRLYQLNRKGWPLRKEINYNKVRGYVQQGGAFLILERPLEQYNNSLRLIFDGSAIRLGSLYCYRVKGLEKE